MLKKLSSLLAIFAISFAVVGCEPQGTDTVDTETETAMPGDEGSADASAEPAEGDDEDPTEGDN